jgi:hypothetical protein
MVVEVLRWSTHMDFGTYVEAPSDYMDILLLGWVHPLLLGVS